MLFSKAAEIFINELTLRAWIHTEDNRRRTLQRNDIAMAITKYDQFDFLIDIVPREEAKIVTKGVADIKTASLNPEQVIIILSAVHRLGILMGIRCYTEFCLAECTGYKSVITNVINSDLKTKSPQVTNWICCIPLLFCDR